MAQNPCQIPLTPSMFFHPNGTPATGANEAGFLGNQQSAMGDPLNGSGNNGIAYPEWYLPWGANAKAYIDLGQEYNITKITVFDGSGQSNVTFAAGLPSANNTPFLTVNTSLYNTWHSPYTVSITTRYITINKTTDDAKIGEIAICGTPVANCSFTMSMATMAPYCFDNFTPGTTTDDAYMVRLAVNRTSTLNGVWKTTILGSTISGKYGDTLTIGPFPIANGTQNFEVADLEVPSCKITGTLNPASLCTSIQNTGLNIAQNKTTTGTAVNGGTPWATPAKAVDGNIDGYTYGAAQSTYHSVWATEPFHQTDLGSVKYVNTIEVWNAEDGNRLSDYYVFFSDTVIAPNATIANLIASNTPYVYNSGFAGRPSVHTVDREIRYVKIIKNGQGFNAFAEVKVIQFQTPGLTFSYNRLWETPNGAAAFITGDFLNIAFEEDFDHTGDVYPPFYKIYNQSGNVVSSGILVQGNATLPNKIGMVHQGGNFSRILTSSLPNNNYYLFELNRVNKDESYYLQFYKYNHLDTPSQGQ